MAIESPQFTLVRQEDDFELRLYPALVVAETRVAADFSDSGNRGFRRLANYIFGGNVSQTKIAMTAPVAQQQSEKIAMTAPVGQQRHGKEYLISFTMPSSYTLENLPKPKDPEVLIKRIPERKVAIVRYSGTWTESHYLKKLEQLSLWMKKQGLDAQGEPTFARFDPPWIPWFLRHNEIQWDVR
ncbi:MAG: heme-binding protein [Proteobacteria bacterium]|nr:heme-binding protein [Pseudomonadota bacterium]